MAQAFLATHGIDLDDELARMQSTRPPGSSANPINVPVTLISNVSLPQSREPHDITLKNGHVSDILPHSADHQPRPGTRSISGSSALLAPSLCHPHIHLDKAYLLSHPRYSHLQLQRGDFAEAMDLTSQAKSSFTRDDLLERGQRVVDESVEAGVTHMRAFVEVDAGVGRKCLDAGVELKLKAKQERGCEVQICAFAQLPLFTASPGDEDGKVIRDLVREAAEMTEVDVIGSTPYVESGREAMERNVEWMVDTSAEMGVHLDFHLDYNLNAEVEPMVWFVIETLKEKRWVDRNPGKTVVLGHCTRLSMFSEEDWRKLRDTIGDLPVNFVGLPTSDLFMMRTPERTRGTLDVPKLIKDYGINACISKNNAGNAFDPQGSCDPVGLASSGVGVYSAGTVVDADILYQCVSTRARKAIGFGRNDSQAAADARTDTAIRIGDRADLLLFSSENADWRTRRSVSEAVYLYDHCKGRRVLAGGKLTSS